MATSDPKHGFKDSNILAPALQFAAITPHNSTDILTGMTRGIYVGVGGNVVAVDKDDNAVSFLGVPTGTVLPIRVRRINATSTTATDIVALY